MNKQTLRTSTLHLYFILLVGLFVLLFFTASRAILIQLIANQESAISSDTQAKIFANGLPFDLFVISFYSAIPILLFLCSLWVANLVAQKALFKSTILYYIISLPILIILTVADIPYFLFFKNKLTESSFQWLSNPAIVFDMLAGNATHLLTLILAVLFCIGLIYSFYKIGMQWVRNSTNHPYNLPLLMRFTLSIVLIVFTFLGMRGRLDHPLKEGDAFFSDNTTANQLALNPIFTLIKSYEAKANLMDEEQAIQLTKQYLNITNPIDSLSPIARASEGELQISKPNVILVIMESMSAAYMEFGGNTQGLTPNLDSLSRKGIMHTNMYSAGIHTNNGVFSTLYGFPAIKRTRPMGTVPLRKYSGIPYTLKQYGYQTMFFTTHDKSFDNLGSFLPFNSFDKVYSQPDYDKEKVVGPFGVADDYLFTFAHQQLSSTTQPFFATILTSSNHDPYIIPKNFKIKYNDKSLDAVHFADWSIGLFLEECSKETWYDNTIFLFIADHGLNVGEQISGFAINYQHIPFIIYQPSKTQATQVHSFMQQIDVFPYLMSILKLPYINNTLGVSPFDVKRDMIYFSSDDKLTALNDEWLYIYYYSGNEYLYRKSEPHSKNYIKEHPEIATQLRQYAFSQTQTADWLFRQNKTKLE